MSNPIVHVKRDGDSIPVELVDPEHYHRLCAIHGVENVIVPEGMEQPKAKRKEPEAKASKKK